MEVDNGNHLILSANKNFLNLCETLGSLKTLIYYEPKFNFFDLKTQKNWSLNLRNEIFPFWIFNKSQRIPNTNLVDYFSIIKLMFCSKKDTIDTIISKKNNVFNFFWEPLTLGVLNTDCKNASAFLLKNVLKETFLRGYKYSGIYQPSQSWGETLINPAVNFLKKKNIQINYGSLLQKIFVENNKVKKLMFKDKAINILDKDLVVLALPPSSVKKIIPSLNLPEEHNTIINIHFKIKIKNNSQPKIIGLVNAITQWIFVKKNYISITLSAANGYSNMDKYELISKIWNEVVLCFGLKNKKLPVFRILMEKKATYNQSPKNNYLVEKINGLPENLKLIGDWTEFNFPCTIESSITSAKKLSDKINENS